jgi:hypothetical protein
LQVSWPETRPALRLRGGTSDSLAFASLLVLRLGRLVTDIGQFAIKDALLDQYDEGRYEGEFGISKIYPSSYVTGDRMVIEVRATLETLALAAIDELPPSQEASLPEPDPIESEPAPIPTPAPKPDPEPDGGHGAHPRDELDELLDDSDEKLFWTLWPLSQSVKLDTTVDRGVFRQQKERLKALGYRFQPVGQTWQRPD